MVLSNFGLGLKVCKSRLNPGFVCVYDIITLYQVPGYPDYDVFMTDQVPGL